MATGGQRFIADLQRWRTASNEKLNALARQSIFELAMRTQINTGPPMGPNVITANLIGSWQPGVNAMPAASQTEEAASFLSGKDIDTELSVVINSMKAGDVFYYVNNAAYAMRQNYGFTGADKLGRYYNQPGKFFLQKTLAQWPQIVRETAIELSMRR